MSRIHEYALGVVALAAAFLFSESQPAGEAAATPVLPDVRPFNGSILPKPTYVPPAQPPHGPFEDEEIQLGSRLTEGQLLAVLDRAGWPQHLWGEAAAVAWCESRWRPDAVGDHGRSLGLFQLWNGWFHWAGEHLDSWNDPIVNARTALRVYQHYSGWRQWTCKP